MNGAYSFVAGVKFSQVINMQIELDSRKERTDPGYPAAYVINAHAPDHLVGKLLTLIEALGLPESQEKAAKDVIRNEVYLLLTGGNEVWINHALHNLIRDFDGAYRKTPAPIGDGGYMSGHYTLTFTDEN